MDRLMELKAKEGYSPKKLASFTCPRCNECPILFAHPSKPPSVECRCCAPFVLNPEFGSDPWDFIRNSERWGHVRPRETLPAPATKRRVMNNKFSGWTKKGLQALAAGELPKAGRSA